MVVAPSSLLTIKRSFYQELSNSLRDRASTDLLYAYNGHVYSPSLCHSKGRNRQNALKPFAHNGLQIVEKSKKAKCVRFVATSIFGIKYLERIKELIPITWARFSCHEFRDNKVRFQHFSLECNADNFLRSWNCSRKSTNGR